MGHNRLVGSEEAADQRSPRIRKIKVIPPERNHRIVLRRMRGLANDRDIRLANEAHNGKYVMKNGED